VSALHAPWPDVVVTAVCDVLGATEYPGLTGSEITEVLRSCRVPDLDPAAAKRRRLATALLAQQARDTASNCVIALVSQAVAPARHVADHGRFYALQAGLGGPLALVGLRVNDEGKLQKAAIARTLDDVARLAGRLVNELDRRQAHPEVLRYCRQELLRQSTFHAVFEATKGLAQRLRSISGSTLDGAELVDACFAPRGGRPIVTINAYATLSEVSEHKGFANLLKGSSGRSAIPRPT